jgi:GT2 family glycosyltransferase
VTPKFSLLLPTRNRAAILAANLRRLSDAAARVPGGAEIIVADNASADGTPQRVRSEFPQVRLVCLDRNRSTAARNVAAEQATGQFLVMLDDDSYLDAASLRRMSEAFEAEPELACVAARVERARPAGSHEGGGLPGVFIGCGAAVRREVFQELGGYTEDFDYYVEEYEFCLRVWQSGRRVRWYEDIVVLHQRSGENRDFGRIIRLLVRNNLRLWDQYAPPALREAMMLETVERYARIAAKEGAEVGYWQGLTECVHLLNGGADPARASSNGSRGRSLTRGEFDSVYGLEEARGVIRAAYEGAHRRPAMFGRGKGAEQLLDLIAELGLSIPVLFDVDCVTQKGEVVGETWHGVEVLPAEAMSRYAPDLIVVGSLSPGACRDLARQARVASPAVRVVEPVVWATVGESADLASGAGKR